MDSLSIFADIVIVAAVLAVAAWIFSRALTKAGLPGWWALLGLIPLVNLVALWVFAFSAWPKFPEQNK